MANWRAPSRMPRLEEEETRKHQNYLLRAGLFRRAFFSEACNRESLLVDNLLDHLTDVLLHLRFSGLAEDRNMNPARRARGRFGSGRTKSRLNFGNFDPRNPDREVKGVQRNTTDADRVTNV